MQTERMRFADVRGAEMSPVGEQHSWQGREGVGGVVKGILCNIRPFHRKRRKIRMSQGGIRQGKVGD
jgi:surface antigen